MHGEVDLGHESDANHLPHDTKDEVNTSLHDILCADVDNGASDTLSAVDGQVEVLGVLELVLGLLVEHTFVDGVGNGVVNQLAKDEPISALGEQVISVGVQLHEVGQVGVVPEGRIDVGGEGLLLCIREGVHGRSGGYFVLSRHVVSNRQWR